MGGLAVSRYCCVCGHQKSSTRHRASIHDSTMYDLESVVVVSWHGRRSGVAVRATRWCRRSGRMLRAGYNYNTAAGPRIMVPEADTAGKGGYQDSEY